MRNAVRHICSSCVCPRRPRRGPVRGKRRRGQMGHGGHMTDAFDRREPGDQQKADAVVAAAKSALAPYADYHKALANGFHIFLPNLPQPIYHFTNYAYGAEAAFRFNPRKPTSLLYKKTADGGYRARWGDVHGSGQRDGRGIEWPHSSQHCSLARARQFLPGAARRAGRVLWAGREIRPFRFDYHQRSLRRGRRQVPSACFRLDGACISISNRPEQDMVHRRRR